MDSTTHSLLTLTWFGLIGLMLVFYVVTDGFDLGVGMLTLLSRKREDHDVMIQSIGHVWDANETWLVVVGGGLFGAFPAAYAILMQALYLPVMAMIAGLIMRGAAIEFRHSSQHGRLWDTVFGVGSLVAAVSQGIVLGKVITGFLPDGSSTAFIAVTAIGVVSGYALLGATWLVKKAAGSIQRWARRLAVVSAQFTVAAAIVLTAATWFDGVAVHARWFQPRVFAPLVVLGALAVLSFVWLLASLYRGRERQPFSAAVTLFMVSFAGLAISLFPDFIPGRLTIWQAASDTLTLAFMLIGIGLVFPVMIGYNLYQYAVFRGKVIDTTRA
ncbi:cytochrome d ubiquinol oxidase subunit II [Paraburkholderia sp. CNPSo 3274]|uniref:cytochrome d ubiquinol oxidase subunit II n=1 Tax=Paraburkholderia sp. CNPSo 3274 TaxID=2940932 RepID=UPI0020B74608|nr:cytochrome d ubiquinol oxidase subunit II [Paraburkholderia sp. CNPSo 3274]MCP3709936.1 cytochrome d ubiquinol oxidase subunit II [Paraburkholderia sp. CNPSo 3274]